MNVPILLELLGVPPQTFKREYFVGGNGQPAIVRQLVSKMLSQLSQLSQLNQYWYA